MTDEVAALARAELEARLEYTKARNAYEAAKKALIPLENTVIEARHKWSALGMELAAAIERDPTNT